jgi:hypothetical protein
VVSDNLPNAVSQTQMKKRNGVLYSFRRKVVYVEGIVSTKALSWECA